MIANVETVIRTFVPKHKANTTLHAEFMRPPGSLHELDCHDDVVQFMNGNCRRILKVNNHVLIKT